MDLFTAHPAIKLAFPPLDLFRLPPSQPHKPAARLPLPPTGTSAARFFQPFMINPGIFHLSLDLKLVLSFAAVYTATVIFLNHFNATRQHKPWAFSKTSIFKALVVTHNAFLALYSAWTLCGMFYLIYSYWPSAAAEEGPNYYAHIAELCCEMESSTFVVLKSPTSVWEGGAGYLGWLFYMSKFYEVVDTLIILARGKKSSTLQTYHHAGVIVCGWAVMRYESPLGLVAVLLNGGIHTLMYSYFTIQTLGISVSMGVKRTLTSLQIAQFLVGLAWAHCYLFVRYKAPIEVAENTFNYDSAPTLHLPASHNHSSPAASYVKARKVASDGAVTCLSDSGEVFCLIVGSIYLVPLIILFVQFFTKSYKPKKTETMPLKQQSPTAKEIQFLAPTSKNPGRGSQDSLNWKNTTYLVGVPLVALIGLFWVPLRIETVCFAIGYAILRAIVITAGYHRLWAHRAYTASPLLKLIFAVIGAGAGQDPIKKWCRDHRAHHRYVDTDEDPYSVKSGFFHAHMGWLLFEKPYSAHDASTTRHVDISDLKSDPIVEWQRRYYFPLAVLMGYIFPTVVCGLCFDDYSGGFIVAGCLGTTGELQGTFCVNSVAHYFGDQPYGIGKSPRDHPLTGLLTLGEGYHNFHHEFPIDYRNGVRWYDFDPTKWLIWTCYKIGLASNLRRFPQNEIQKGRLQRRQEKLGKECEMVDWGVPLADLPVMEWEEFQQQARTGCNIIVIRGVVHDVSSFVTEHPGGTAMITGAIGKDATKMFEGGVYGHSGAAFNLLDTMRIAVIK